MKAVRLAILGFGQRGIIYASYAKQHAEEFVVTAITDTDPQKREIAAREYGCPVFDSYEKMLSFGVDADIIAVATQDGDHPEHAIACMKKGYDVLLEKPIANTLEGCSEIEKAAKKYGRKVIVCHVLRYTPFYGKIKEIIDSGRMGDIVTVSTSENVGYYHQAHSFVRGPWRNSGSSSPMILAKCCHDMDLLRWLIGEKCRKVASFGSLMYFCKENAPEGCAKFCSECPLKDCIYNAQKIYKEYRWMANYFCNEKGEEAMLKALKGSQYDRCVFHSDNDVVDHQVSIFKFDKGITASHTMTAFSRTIYRGIKVHATKAELVGIMEDNFLELRVLGGGTEVIPIDTADANGNHGGGDIGLMHELYLERNGMPVKNITYLDVSIDSHKMAFAAEEARVTEKTVDVL